MSKPKYDIGDRLTLNGNIEIKIVRVLDSYQIAYVFELVNAPSMKSVITQSQLIKAITT